jgi:alpha-galactosidase
VNCWNCEVGHGSWTSWGILNILDKQAGLRKYAAPGAWNDPDMMEVGNLPTLAENRSHFALWAMLAAPLIAGTDVIGMKPEIAAILTNPRLIAIDQDPLGLQGFAWLRTPELEVWARPLSGERWAVAVLNRSDAQRRHTIDFSREPLSDDLNQKFARIGERHYRITDEWTGEASGATRAPLEVTVAARDTAVFLLTPTS